MTSKEACCKPKKIAEINATLPASVPISDGFYRRPLPSSTCTAFESAKGRQLFKEALADGTIHCF